MNWTPDPKLVGHELTLTANANKSKVSEYIWRTWSGQRYVDGVEHHGSIFVLGTDKVAANQNRACHCCRPASFRKDMREPAGANPQRNPQEPCRCPLCA